jgi:hypothetical protein
MQITFQLSIFIGIIREIILINPMKSFYYGYKESLNEKYNWDGDAGNHHRNGE